MSRSLCGSPLTPAANEIRQASIRSAFINKKETIHMLQAILTTLLLLSSSLTQAHTPTPNGGKVTISECIAATTSKIDLLECMKNRNADMDNDEDHAVVKCLLNSDDKRIYWYEDCIRG